MPQTLIIGTGHYVPERVVTNAELVTYVGGSAQWIEERTGIRERRWAKASESTSELGLRAAQAALDDAGCDAADLDLIIFTTLSPDLAFPGCGVLLQDQLGATATPALDVRNQCSGYLYALQVAHAYIQASMHRTILVVGAEIHSAGLDISEEGRGITVLFGDGAGAVVLTRGEDAPGRGVLDVRLGSDGSGATSLYCERPGSQGGTHISVEDLRNKRHFPRMNGRMVFRRAIETLTEELAALFDDHTIDPATHDLLLVPHQANRRINDYLADHFNIPPERVMHTIESYGNTTAASIPMALDIARQRDLIGPETLVVHAAFGSGFTWGTALVAM